MSAKFIIPSKLVYDTLSGFFICLCCNCNHVVINQDVMKHIAKAGKVTYSEIQQGLELNDIELSWTNQSDLTPYVCPAINLLSPLPFIDVFTGFRCLNCSENSVYYSTNEEQIIKHSKCSHKSFIARYEECLVQSIDGRIKGYYGVRVERVQTIHEEELQQNLGEINKLFEASNDLIDYEAQYMTPFLNKAGFLTMIPQEELQSVSKYLQINQEDPFIKFCTDALIKYFTRVHEEVI